MQQDRPRPGAASAGPPSLSRLPLHVLRGHLWLILPVLAYAALSQAIIWGLGLEDRLSYALYSTGSWKVFALAALAFTLGYPVYVMIFRRPERLLAFMAQDLRTRVLTPERLLSGLLVLAIMPMFFSVYTSLKAMIPAIQPYTWDPLLIDLERAIHGGKLAWERLQPLFGRPLLTSIVNAGYHLWFFMLFGFVFWQAFTLADRALRAQFFLSFMLIWTLLGNVAATLLASVGPCFYGAVTGQPDPFAPLMDYLYRANEVYPVWALGVQEMLWEGFNGDVVERGHGISAMPSLHVAAAVLFALLAWRVDRRFGAVMVFYVLVIIVGSVHLGWHYAIDGYASILAVPPIWRFAGWLVARAGSRIAEPARVTAPQPA